MSKFHLVNGEPKPCKASIRSCPVGGEHYPDEATAREAFERANKNNTFNNLSKPKRTLKSDVKRVRDNFSGQRGIKIAGVAVTSTLVAGGAIASHHDANVGKDFNNTPYSVSVNVADSGGQPYSGYVVGANLKHSDFSECAPNYNKAGKASSVSCKTVDGKFVVTAQPNAQHIGSNMHQTLENMTIKDNSTNKEVSLDHTSTNIGDNIFMPKASVNK